MSGPLTLMQIELVLHYYYSPEEHPYVLDGSSGARESIKELLDLDMLMPVSTTNYGATYASTDRARVYVEAVRSLPLPVQSWAMP